MPEAGDESRRFPFSSEGRLQSSEFLRVFHQGRSYASPYFVVFCLKAGPGKKLGVVVKKRSVRLAVDRNWLKRRIRESYRQLRPSLQSECLLVVLARREALSVSQAILQETLRHSLEEASVLVRG